MPQHKDLKRLVRARMAETSENYTQALTALLSRTRLDPLPDGWFTAGSHPAIEPEISHLREPPA